MKKYLNQIYNMDCLEFMKTLPDKCVDLVITDPPYGIGKLWVGGKGHGWGNAREQGDVRNDWDNTTPSQEYFDEIFRISKNQIIWGGNYFNLPTSRGWLIWNKPERGFSLAEAELAWTSKDMVIRVFDCHRSDSSREHPTQKPLELMEWCLKFFPDIKIVFDPYLGSGTTAVACKRNKIDYIGCEINKEYFKFAEDRLKAQSNPLF